MSKNLELFVSLLLQGGSRFASDVTHIANTTKNSTRQMANSWAAVDNQMSNVKSSLIKIGAFLGGGALLRQAITDVAEFERGLTEMRLTGELTAAEMAKIQKHIMDLSSETLQLPEDQLAAFKDMVAAGIDPKQVNNGLKSIDRTATATFANVKDIGMTAVDLLQKMDIKPEKLERAFNIMHKAGKAGRFELRDMARFFPEVLAAASQFGIKGEKGISQISAMLQIARRNRAEPGEAATDMKAFFSHIVTYRKQFMKAKFNVFDYVDLKSGKFKAGKDIDMFFEELKEKTHGGSAAMLKAMGIQDYEASNFMSGIMKDWSDYKKIRDESLGAADKNIIGEDFDKVKETSWARLKELEIKKSKAMKSLGSSWLAEKSSQIGTWAIENPVKAGGSLIGGYSAYKFIQSFLGGLGGLIPSGGIPVSVTNMPKDFKNPATLHKETGGLFGSPKPASKAAPLFSTGVAAVPAIATGVIGYISMEVGEYLAKTEAENSSTKRLMDLRSRHMVMGGGPNSFQVRTIDNELTRRGVDVKNNINLTLNIDERGRKVSMSNDMNTTLNTTLNTLSRGNFDMMKSH